MTDKDLKIEKKKKSKKEKIIRSARIFKNSIKYLIIFVLFLAFIASFIFWTMTINEVINKDWADFDIQADANELAILLLKVLGSFQGAVFTFLFIFYISYMF